jgi:hypothetical protein
MLMALTLIDKCRDNKELSQNLGVQIGTNRDLRVKTLRDSAKIYSQAAKIVSSEALAREFERQLHELSIKEPETVTKIETKTVYKTEIKVAEPVYIDSFPHLRLPQPFFKREKWATVGGTINRLGFLQLDSLVFPVSYTFAIGDTLRSGFFNRLFRRKDSVLRLKVDNPYAAVTGMDNYLIKRRPKWYETPAFNFGAGLICGLALRVVQK